MENAKTISGSDPSPSPGKLSAFRIGNLGVRWRLLVAFLGVSAFVVLSAIAAIYAFSKVGNVLTRMAQEQMPAALVSQEISRRAERIVASAPTFLSLKSVAEQERLSKRFASDFAKLNELLRELKTSVSEGSELKVIENAVQSLNTNLSLIANTIHNNTQISEYKQESLDQLFDLYTEFRLLLTPAMEETEEKIDELKDDLENSDSNSANSITTEKALFALSEDLAVLLRMQLELLKIKDILLEIATTKEVKKLQTAAISVGWGIDALEDFSKQLNEDVRKDMGSKFEPFRIFLTGRDSIVATRKREQEGIASITVLLAQNDELSRVLTDAVARLVTSLRHDVTSANREALEVQQMSMNVMIGIAALSLVSSALIVWLYVGRSIVARLEALSGSMLAIAGGNLRAPLPAPDRGDEIGRMAEALTVFRDTAIEVEENNLREIEETRRRLVDAIENTSEGFAFYDSDDRLELCNNRYNEFLYQDSDDPLTPGMTFEEIIQGVAERGFAVDAEDRVDDWTAERLARHRNPASPELQQRTDGRWMMISERKTGSGGIVTIIADITDLKQREEELSEKSNTLEQLSNQLAKYLSPQIYDSIFTGKQEVKVASRRKKLTVFFSDIAGFTETADRLESEELTQLLNHYLTEMSRIALDHGATIDKYVGDAIMIFFGDPETKGNKEDALACVKMAIAMRDRLHELQEIWRRSGIEKPLRCRMGIHTGFCTVGNFGSEDRMDYTIIGNAVNTASRLETLATPGEILISYETFAHVREQIHCEGHGEAEVKGIAYPITTYQVMDYHENLGESAEAIHTELPHLKLDADVQLMSPEQRQEAASALRRALNRLSTSDVEI